MADVPTGADRLLRLAYQYASSGKTRMEAQCHYQRAKSLGLDKRAAEQLAQSADTSVLVGLRQERAAEYERAAELFASVGFAKDAGRSLYRAAYEYNWLGFVGPEYREKCYSTCEAAAKYLAG